MNKLANYLIVIFFSIAVNSCGQTKNKSRNYIIDNSLKEKFKSFEKSFSEEGFSEVSFKLFHNDSIILNTNIYPNNFREYTNFENFKGDTIKITVTNNDGNSAYGFIIYILKDTCIARLIVQSNVANLSLNDSVTKRQIIYVPCKSFNLKLSSEPKFKKEEVVDGIIELTSDNYYEIRNQKNERSKIEMKGFFRTKPLEWYTKYLKPHK